MQTVKIRPESLEVLAAPHRLPLDPELFPTEHYAEAVYNGFHGITDTVAFKYANQHLLHGFPDICTGFGSYEAEP
jgi:hypothetical protein